MDKRILHGLAGTILLIVNGISAQDEPLPRTGMHRLPTATPSRRSSDRTESIFQPVVPASFDGVWQVAGVSPAAGGFETDEILARLEAAEAEIRALREQNATDSGTPVAIRETTLDATAVSNNLEMDSVLQQPGPPDLAILTPLTLPNDDGKITFKPGARLQPRYNFNNLTDNNDFLMNRFRVKGSGALFGIATYGMELKFDGTGGFETQAVGIVENAWIDFSLGEGAFLRAGLYDIPFSRDALTSDSRLLFMDRSLIKSEFTEKGLQDNTVGLMFHGRPFDGRLEVAWGVFDNVVFENVNLDAVENSLKLMPAGRLAWNFLDPAPTGYGDYRGSYVGEGERLAVGANFAYLEEALERDRLGIDPDRAFQLYAYGIDLFFNKGPWVFQAEYDVFFENSQDDEPLVSADGWYVQGGFIVHRCGPRVIELAARHEQNNPEDTSEPRRRHTSIGLNTYIRDHFLKIQAEYTWRSEKDQEIQNDLCQVQLQMDF